jgi:hypothetical protein
LRSNIAHNLSFPGVVKVYNLEYYQQKPFLVYEYIGGISLKEYLAGCPLPLPKFLAISLAKENQLIQDQALANKMAGYFYLALGKEQFAKIYLSHAYSCYDPWGAKTQLQKLEKTCSQYIVQLVNTADINNTTNTTTISIAGDKNYSHSWLDCAIVKHYQNLAQDLALDKLLKNLMKILSETARAQRGYLILKSDNKNFLKLDNWKIEAIEEVQGDSQTALVNSVPLVNQLPKSILQYVIRTNKPVVYQNAVQ